MRAGYRQAIESPKPLGWLDHLAAAVNCIPHSEKSYVQQTYNTIKPTMLITALAALIPKAELRILCQVVVVSTRIVRKGGIYTRS